MPRSVLFMIDFTPATSELARVVAGVRDDQLDLPTPCAEWTVADLLAHVDGCGTGFALAARKESPAGAPPAPDGANLPEDWRRAIAERLEAMAQAWRDPAAWEGPTSVGGVPSSGAECAAVGMDEMVVHTWDLARSTGQECTLDPAAVEQALGFARGVAAQAPDGVPGLFGPATRHDTGADPVTELLGLTGRDPDWRPASAG